MEKIREAEHKKERDQNVEEWHAGAAKAAIMTDHAKDRKWTCEGCGKQYAEYVNGCPVCWDSDLTREENRAKYPNRKVVAVEATDHAKAAREAGTADGLHVAMVAIVAAILYPRWSEHCEDYVDAMDESIWEADRLITKVVKHVADKEADANGS